MSSEVYGEKLKDLYPVVEPNLSDSGAADCVLEFLVMAGQRSLPEVRQSDKFFPRRLRETGEMNRIISMVRVSI